MSVNRKINNPPPEVQQTAINDQGNAAPLGLFEFLTELGKALTSAGVSVVAITSILERIATAYGVQSEILLSPTFLIIKLGSHESAPITVSVANQSQVLLPLNQVSELYTLINQAESTIISPADGTKRIKQILSQKHRFGSFGIFFGYILFAIGLGLLLYPTPQQLVVSALFGGVVGLLLILSQSRPRFSLILPVFAAFLVSALLSIGIKQGLVTGSFILVIPALAYFLPGATLTTGMFELATGNMVSGASRTIYGVAILFLLLFGIVIGNQLVGTTQQGFLITRSFNTIGLWAPYLGVLIFGMGVYLFMSLREKDMPWVLLNLYIALIGQQVGSIMIGSYFGGFLGSLLMTVSGTYIGRSPSRTPDFVSILPAFWILVPGSLGFISLVTFIGQSYITAVTNAALVVMTLVAISLGLLVGAAVVEPFKREG
ncbi:MAG TPA: threonine/serine exporter family protein [Candidatus Acidoferrum sp.]|nr:threonine/serine exporter family protein [Candidatus Acidoferrum sp.]